jgi:hypothetical protein
MRRAVVLLALGASACATGHALKPSRADVVSAISQAPAEVTGNIDFSVPGLRLKSCRPFPEEPTEFHCQLRVQEASGAWTTVSATVTYDKGGWVLLALE